MKTNTKKIMSMALGLAILVGSFGLTTTIEASAHHHAPYMDAGDPPPAPQPPERHHHHGDHPEAPPAPPAPEFG
jgi:hypothetical protein